MENNPAYYTDLISRYFSAELSGKELQVLSDWLKADKANKDLFREYQATWQLLAKSAIEVINLDDEWDALQHRIQLGSSDIKVPISTINEAAKIRFSGFRSFRKVAAAILVLVASSFMLYFYFAYPRKIELTAKTGNMLIRLPDGTAVALNMGSTITYPEKFIGVKREIEISGEAYLHVKHDSTIPFVISSGNVCLEVLGTSFNVNTQASSGKMEVVLTTGRVAVYYEKRKEEKVILAPGEKAEIEKSGQKILKTTNSDPNYRAWETRKLVFDNTTLGEIVRTMNSVYHVNIRLRDNELAGCRVTATFSEQPLNAVLNVLQKTLDLQITKSAASVEISGKGCQ
jgi:transmembrane sensor